MMHEVEEYLNMSVWEKHNYLKKRMVAIQDELKKIEDIIIQDNLFIKIYKLELSVRSINCLSYNNIDYVGDLVKCSEAQLLRTPNFGRKSLNEVKEVLKNLGFELGMDVVWPACIIQYKDKRFLNEEGAPARAFLEDRQMGHHFFHSFRHMARGDHRLGGGDAD